MPEGKVSNETGSGTDFRLLLDLGEFSLQSAENYSDSALHINHRIIRNIIHFYFCLEGGAEFVFGPQYKRTIERHRNYFFYNPDADLSFQLLLHPQSRLVALSIQLESLHQLFTHEPLPFLRPENVKSKFYDERNIPPNLLIVLNQLFNVNLSENAARLFYHGKVLEILGLYFSDKKPNTESCPFLNDQETVRKIKNAKEYLLKHMDAPPHLKDLARIAGLNEYQLKVGFKEIYGNTVYGYLLDHKLDYARVLLDSAKLQVNEVAYQIGYANPSHFIAAFKKKFGITPKKYLMNLSRKLRVNP